MTNYTDDESNEPTGTLGKLANAKVIAWVVIVGLVALTAGAVGFVVAIS